MVGNYLRAIRKIHYLHGDIIYSYCSSLEQHNEYSYCCCRAKMCPTRLAGMLLFCYCCFFLFFSISFFLSSPFFFSLLCSRNSEPGSQQALLPAPHCAHFYREKTSALSSLVDSRRPVVIYKLNVDGAVPLYYRCCQVFLLSCFTVLLLLVRHTFYVIWGGRILYFDLRIFFEIGF